MTSAYDYDCVHLNLYNYRPYVFSRTDTITPRYYVHDNDNTSHQAKRMLHNFQYESHANMTSKSKAECFHSLY